MKRITIMIMAIFVAAALMVTLSCDTEEEETHSVTVKWDIGGVPSCKSEWDREDEHISLSFDKVRITVFENKGDSEPVHDAITVECSEHQYTVHQLERGTYHVQIEAMADFQGQYLPYFEGSLEIVAPADDTEYAASLRLSTGSVEVEWGFERGQCNSSRNMVKNVIITLEGTDVSNMIESESISCEQAQYSFEDMTWDLYKLTVEGFNEAGELTHRGIYEEDDLGESGPHSDTNTGADTAVDSNRDNLLDIRPGTHIAADQAYVTLMPI